MSSVTVKYYTKSGTATAGADFIAVSGDLTFFPGQSKATISVPILDDDEQEDNETFTVVLEPPDKGQASRRRSKPPPPSVHDRRLHRHLQLRHQHQHQHHAPHASGKPRHPAPTAAAATTPLVLQVVIGDPSVCEVTIEDNDTVGNLTFDQEFVPIKESVGKVLLTVVRIGGTAGTIGCSFATKEGSGRAGTDFVAQEGTLTFPPGVTRKEISIEIIDDANYEKDETFQARAPPLAGPCGRRSTSAPSLPAAHAALFTPRTSLPPAQVVLSDPTGGANIKEKGVDKEKVRHRQRRVPLLTPAPWAPGALLAHLGAPASLPQPAAPNQAAPRRRPASRPRPSRSPALTPHRRPRPWSLQIAATIKIINDEERRDLLGLMVSELDLVRHPLPQPSHAPPPTPSSVPCSSAALLPHAAGRGQHQAGELVVRGADHVVPRLRGQRLRRRHAVRALAPLQDHLRLRAAAARVRRLGVLHRRARFHRRADRAHRRPRRSKSDRRPLL